MDIQEVVGEGTDSINLAQERDRWLRFLIYVLKSFRSNHFKSRRAIISSSVNLIRDIITAFLQSDDPGEQMSIQSQNSPFWAHGLAPFTAVDILKWVLLTKTVQYSLGSRSTVVGWGYKPEGMGLTVDGVFQIFHRHNAFTRTTALGWTQPLTEMSTRNLPWGIKAAGA
jgi:hypothetical protein